MIDSTMDPAEPTGTPGTELARTRWGRVKFGAGTVPAMRVAIPAGVVLAALLGVVAASTGVAGPSPLVGGIAFAFVTVWAFIGLVWALVVDRMTLQGAANRPEESVESRWYERASSGGFTDTVTVVGLALAFVVVTDVDLSATVALAGVVVVAALSFAARYLLARRAG